MDGFCGSGNDEAKEKGGWSSDAVSLGTNES